MNPQTSRSIVACEWDCAARWASSTAVSAAARTLVMLAVALVPATTRADTHGGGKRHRGLRSPATRRHVRPVRHDRAHAAIVGGHFARSGQFPWVARIVARHGNLVDL